MRFWCFCVLAAGLLLLGAGCISMEDVTRAVEPLINAGVDFAANSASEAVKEKLAGSWGGGEIAAAVTASIVGVAGAIKGAVYAWNRKPKSA